MYTRDFIMDLYIASLLLSAAESLSKLYPIGEMIASGTFEGEYE